MKYDIFNVGNYSIFYESNQNGGGMHFGQDYINVIKDRYSGRIFKLAYEFCCGPAYIGFSLLEAGVVEELVLSDIHPAAFSSIEKTREFNNVSNKAEFFLQAGVADLPIQNIDLCVSNPPHFLNKVGWLSHIEERIYRDQDWAIHREFYRNIKSKMSPDGVILMQENALGSSLHDFEEMIDSAGLVVTDMFPKKNVVGCDFIYYIEMKIA